MDLINYIYDECHRQEATNYGDFARAWEYTWAYERVGNPKNPWDFLTFVQDIARYVEPDLNSKLRTSHVGFMHGGSAAPAGEVRERFDRWCESAWSFVDANNICGHVEPSLVDLFIKSLLDIHPWSDGNGRTASILRNWMLGTLDDPTPLPEFQF